MLEGAVTLIFIKDFTGSGATRYFIKTADVLREICAEELGAIDSYIICHDFWLIKDELGGAGNLPGKVFDLDEVHAIVAQKRNLREQRERQGIALKIPASMIEPEILDAYVAIVERRKLVDISVIESACNGLAAYAQSLLAMAEINDELTRLKEVELPLFNMLIAHSSAGICVNTDRIREAR